MLFPLLYTYGQKPSSHFVAGTYDAGRKENVMIKEAARYIEVRDSYDVIVAGGGIAGIAASLAARRQGKRVLLIEREYALGGLATLGLVTMYLPLCDGMGRRVIYGIGEELMRLSFSRGAECPLSPAWSAQLDGATVPKEELRAPRCLCRYNAALFALLAEEKLLAEGVEILYGTVVCGAVVKRQKIAFLTVENKSGRYAFGARSVVDATGDADIAALCGAETATFGRGNILAGWYYRGAEGNATDLMILGSCDAPDGEKDDAKKENGAHRRFSGLDGAELSEQVCLSHALTLEHFLHGGDLSPTHTLNAISVIPQVRMTRRIVGKELLDTDRPHTERDDSVGLFPDWRKAGPVYELPFGAVCSATIRNLAAAGRNISTTDRMWDITRVIPVCAVSGEAAGIAAAISDDFGRLPLKKLQAALRKGGVKLHEKELPE